MVDVTPILAIVVGDAELHAGQSLLSVEIGHQDVGVIALGFQVPTVTVDLASLGITASLGRSWGTPPGRR
jgi:hypothetical protein